MSISPLEVWSTATGFGAEADEFIPGATCPACFAAHPRSNMASTIARKALMHPLLREGIKKLRRLPLPLLRGGRLGRGLFHGLRRRFHHGLRSRRGGIHLPRAYGEPHEPEAAEKRQELQGID